MSVTICRNGTIDTGALPSLNATATGNVTSETATSINFGTSPAGTLCVVCIAANNAGASGASSISSVTDSTGGNTWTQAVLANQTPGSAANDGLTVAIYYSILKVALTSGVNTISVNFSPATTAKAIEFLAFSEPVTGVPPAAYSYRGLSGSNKGTASATYTVGTASLLPGDILIGFVGNESNTAPGADSDSTGGAWSGAQTQSSGGGGGDATKMAMSHQAKYITAAGAQTYNGATGASTDWAACYAVFHALDSAGINAMPTATMQAANW